MSKQANAKLIGGFVVGAIVLVVAGLLLFGSGKLFSKQRKFVLFFEDSVKGLNVGAPVDFKGVNIGTVTGIKIVVGKEDLAPLIPVFIEIDPERISFGGTESDLMKKAESMGAKTFIELIIKRGLRAQLAMTSFVTGQLGIHLDYYPDKPARLVGAEPGYAEIPTTESSLSALSKTFASIPLTEIADKVSKTLDGIEKVVNSPDLQQAIVSLNQAIREANKLLQNVDSEVQPLANGAGLTISEAQKMFAYAAQLVRNLDSRIPQLIASFEDTSKAAGTTIRGANKAMDGLTGDNSPVRLELLKTLDELSSAARSFRILAQYLESHPDSLIKGKGR